MKKKLLIFMFVFIVIVISKYVFSDYSIQYNINKHTIEEIYKDGRIYFEIDNKYNFDIYTKRKLNKILLNSIESIAGENFVCVYPKSKSIETYPLCIMDNVQVDYNLINSDLLEKYKEKNIEIEKGESNFIYYNNLNESTYVALWNYKGYIVMNGNSYKNIEIFNTDRYDNSLSYMKDNIIYMPDYDEEHEFSKLITLDLVSRKRNVIYIDYKIDYDSYIVGSIKNNLYIFDNKHSVLYEINVKKDKTNIKASNEIGYYKYDNGKFVTCSKSEYKVDKIKFDSNESIYRYKYNNSLFKTYSDNKNIKTKIHEKNISIVGEYRNKLYYVDEDFLYKYTPKEGSQKVLYFFELNFNKSNTIFVYNK